MTEPNNDSVVLPSLANLKKDYDEVLGKLRDEDNRQRNNTLAWMFKSFGRALFNYTPFSSKNTNSIITKVASSSLLQNLGLAAFLINVFNGYLETINTTLLIATILSFFLSVVVNFKRLMIILIFLHLET
jgi:hypothetical protein